MRIKLSENPRPEFIIGAVRNSEVSANIPKGTPLILNLSSAAQPTTAGDGFQAGYEDGLQVVLPGTAGANPSANFLFGVAVDTILNGQLGEAMMYGVIPYALVVRATRAASTNSWSSSASSSLAGGFLLAVDTLNNAFSTYASTASLVQPNQWGLVCVDSFSSVPASASATSDTRTALIQGYRTFVRLM
jgi:hypothetical protein